MQIRENVIRRSNEASRELVCEHKTAFGHVLIVSAV